MSKLFRLKVYPLHFTSSQCVNDLYNVALTSLQRHYSNEKQRQKMAFVQIIGYVLEQRAVKCKKFRIHGQKVIQQKRYIYVYHPQFKDSNNGSKTWFQI